MVNTELINKSIDRHFPFKTFNPGQREAIQKVVASFLLGKKHVIMEAPTGIGKSAIATTVHRVLKDVKGSWRTTIVTATKGLQDQYEDLDKEILSLKGKTNYDCPLGKGPYNSANCRKMVHSGGCRKAVICPYYTTRKSWEAADLRLTNTSFQVEACPMIVMMPENMADLIIVDECHTIDEHLVEHSSLKINIPSYLHMEDEIKGRIADFINEFVNCTHGDAIKPTKSMRDTASMLAGYLDLKISEYQERLQKENFKEWIAGTIEEMQQITDKIHGFAKLPGEWILMKFGFAEELDLKPVYASQVADYGLFRKGKCFLHMSATICGFESYMQTLGIDRKEAYFFGVDNPIPVENRRVKILPVIKTSGDFDKVRLTEVVDKIISRHQGENGIVHTVSFQLAQDIFTRSKFSKSMKVSNNREEILDYLKNPKGRIILSPSIEQGYDFKGDMSRFQILPKVPFAYLGDPWVSLNMKRSGEWYSRKAILRMVQACGRSVRGVDDHAMTYIIDSNVERMIKYNEHLFPKWFIESLE